MSKLALCGRGMLLGALILLEGPALAFGQDIKAPQWKHGLEFRIRRAGQPDFDRNTPRFGCEFYIDPIANQSLYISEIGALSLLGAPASPPATETKTPKWLHAMELKVRKAGETEFKADTKKYGIEVFRDDNTGFLVYVTDSGWLAAVKTPGATPAAEAKPPTWLHGLELKVRSGGEADFTDKTKKYGIEVFRDENTGNLIYIAETGSIAVVPSRAGPSSAEAKAPQWLHGLEFRVRKAEETDFTNNTLNYGAEIFKDENTNNIVYITQTGSIAVVPAGTVSGGQTKAPKWLQGVALKVRRAGETDFTKDTKKFGGEIFRDENTGNLVYLCETGAMAVSSGR